jgi:hypothetical protein
MKTIDVTNNDIYYGVRFSHTDNPIALAIKRAKQRRFGVQVFDTHAIIGGISYTLPEPAREFSADWWNEQPVAPITFELGEGC